MVYGSSHCYVQRYYLYIPIFVGTDKSRIQLMLTLTYVYERIKECHFVLELKGWTKLKRTRCFIMK